MPWSAPLFDQGQKSSGGVSAVLHWPCWVRPPAPSPGVLVCVCVCLRRAGPAKRVAGWRLALLIGRLVAQWCETRCGLLGRGRASERSKPRAVSVCRNEYCFNMNQQPSWSEFAPEDGVLCTEQSVRGYFLQERINRVNGLGDVGGDIRGLTA